MQLFKRTKNVYFNIASMAKIVLKKIRALVAKIY